VIKGKAGSIYFSGDSGYSDHFKKTGEKYGPFDLAFIECGAYGKYWPYIHMVPEESAQAGLDVNAKVVLPIHWGKFNLAFHPWKEPVERLTTEANRLGVQLAFPIPGQEIRSDLDLPQDKWWQNIN
jgi:L-ascorbate metabolism protein UlaG (beta-lactamase superfamily)